MNDWRNVETELEKLLKRKSKEAGLSWNYNDSRDVKKIVEKIKGAVRRDINIYAD